MELGCDVIVEKPLTTTFENCRRILATQGRTGQTCTVAMNYRYTPRYSQIKDLLMSGVIGNVFQVNWTTGVELAHGSRYFHRWHGEKECSGTLLVHKCCHLRRRRLKCRIEQGNAERRTLNVER